MPGRLKGSLPMQRMESYILSLLILFLVLSVWPGCSEDCENVVCPEETETENVTFYRLLGPYYPQPVSGDAEYGTNHGPYVVLEGRVYVAGDDSLMCHMFMSAQEIGGSTRGECSIDELLYRAPEGWIITYAGMNPDSCSATGSSSVHGWHFVGCFGWDFMYIGDTVGADVCAGSDCSQFHLGICPQVEIQKK